MDVQQEHDEPQRREGFGGRVRRFIDSELNRARDKDKPTAAEPATPATPTAEPTTPATPATTTAEPTTPATPATTTAEPTTPATPATTTAEPTTPATPATPATAQEITPPRADPR